MRKREANMHNARPHYDIDQWPTDTNLKASQRSKQWAFMRRFVVPDLDNPDHTYLSRLRVMQTPWFGVYLHRFDTPDSRPTLHDHPWNFISLIPVGGYVEKRPEGWFTRRWFNVMRATDCHYIEKLLRTPTWSILLVGRRRRKWGYVEPSPGGYRWTAFDAHPHNDEFESALSARHNASDDD